MTRRLIALAGPPGAGKSTLAPVLAQALGARVVPMDGFHLDNILLDAAGLRPRKGAPETFDTAGLAHALRRLKAGEDEVILPAFDRDRDAAIAGAIWIGPEDRVLIVEGNYLLADLPGWAEMQDIWDATVFLDVPEARLQTRFATRWRDQGLTGDAAQARVDNDMRNVRAVLTTARPADVRLADDGATPGELAAQAMALLQTV
ncbi:MAG: nucleoside/nucleotide kinase family protein [Paracoccus denitrificans]|nr:MAG: nucleoside/nucleotide kinase family protein [Paracoccus denitrificans]PZO84996.1 MAG: nucleoside/nucleotide kinase family protein [Paracoccus denitrificans]